MRSKKFPEGYKKRNVRTVCANIFYKLSKSSIYQTEMEASDYSQFYKPKNVLTTFSRNVCVSPFLRPIPNRNISNRTSVAPGLFVEIPWATNSHVNTPLTGRGDYTINCLVIIGKNE